MSTRRGRIRPRAPRQRDDEPGLRRDPPWSRTSSCDAKSKPTEPMIASALSASGKNRLAPRFKVPVRMPVAVAAGSP
jgi:hypothetical protein